MSEKYFKMESIKETKPNQIIVIDNGKFRIIMNNGKFEEVLGSKNIPPEKRKQAWEAILNFRDEVNSVDKEKMHIGSTDPIGAISSKLYEVFGDRLLNDEDIQSLFSN